jgi:mannose-6-phosphate isomerase-like protein (cupin superfamily)
MKEVHVEFKSSFEVVLGNNRSQAAEMVIPAGESEGGPDNRHKGADQWLLVIAGRGVAVVNGKSYRLSKSTLVLIERGDRHEIRNTGRTPLKTLNFYVPPAYGRDGDELTVGKS